MKRTGTGGNTSGSFIGGGNSSPSSSSSSDKPALNVNLKPAAPVQKKDDTPLEFKQVQLKKRPPPASAAPPAASRPIPPKVNVPPPTPASEKPSIPSSSTSSSSSSSQTSSSSVPKCPGCGAEKTTKFCLSCGYSDSPKAASSAPAPSSPSGIIDFWFDFGNDEEIFWTWKRKMLVILIVKQNILFSSLAPRNRPASSSKSGFSAMFEKTPRCPNCGASKATKFCVMCGKNNFGEEMKTI